MNLTCFYCQTPFTLSMEQKVAALRKMHAENLHHYDAHCPRCGRANAISRERLEMFTPGWEEAIKQPAMASAGSAAPAAELPNAAPSSPETQVMESQRAVSPVMKKQAAAGSSRRRHAPAAKKAAGKSAAKKAAASKSATKKSASKATKKAATKAKSKSASRKSAKKSKSR